MFNTDQASEGGSAGTQESAIIIVLVVLFVIAVTIGMALLYRHRLVRQARKGIDVPQLSINWEEEEQQSHTQSVEPFGEQVPRLVLDFEFDECATPQPDETTIHTEQVQHGSPVKTISAAMRKHEARLQARGIKFAKRGVDVHEDWDYREVHDVVDRLASSTSPVLSQQHQSQSWVSTSDLSPMQTPDTSPIHSPPRSKNQSPIRAFGSPDRNLSEAAWGLPQSPDWGSTVMDGLQESAEWGNTSLDELHNSSQPHDSLMLLISDRNQKDAISDMGLELDIFDEDTLA